VPIGAATVLAPLTMWPAFRQWRESTVVMPRESGASSTPRPLRSITGASVDRFSESGR